MSEETKNRPTQLEELDLWKLRAFMTEQGRLAAEADKIRLQQANVQKDLEVFSSEMAGKYGEDAQVRPDGSITYIPLAEEAPPAPRVEAKLEAVKDEKVEEE